MNLVKKRRILMLLGVFLAGMYLLQGAGSIYAGQERDYQSYYKVLPGSKEWDSLQGAVEKTKACELDEETISLLSTEELLEVVLEYPLLINIYLYDGYSESIKHWKDSFNGLYFLLEREDALEKIIRKYEEFANSDYELQVDDFKKIDALECMLYDEATVAAMTDDKCSRLSAAADKIIELKELYAANTLSGRSNEINLLVNVRYVLTPKGSVIEGWVRGEELTDAQKQNMDNEFARIWNKAKKLRSATTMYNCYSYAFYSRSADNDLWINNPTAYMTDGSYVPSKKLEDGLIIVYGDNVSSSNHAGVLKLSEMIGVIPHYVVVSKCGQYGLYEHEIKECSYYAGEDYLKLYVKGN